MGSIEALQVDPSAFDYDTLRYTLARHSQWSQVDEKVLIHFTHYIPIIEACSLYLEDP